MNAKVTHCRTIFNGLVGQRSNAIAVRLDTVDDDRGRGWAEINVAYDGGEATLRPDEAKALGELLLSASRLIEKAFPAHYALGRPDDVDMPEVP